MPWMLSKSPFAVILLQTCCTWQVCFFFLQIIIFCHFSQLRKSAERQDSNSLSFVLLRIIPPINWVQVNVCMESRSFVLADVWACMQKGSDDTYDNCCTCMTGNRMVLRRGYYLFTHQNIWWPRNLCFSRVAKVMTMGKKQILARPFGI